MTDQELIISPGVPTKIGFDHDLDVVVVIGWSAQTGATQVVSWGSEQYREQAAQANCWAMRDFPRPSRPISMPELAMQYVSAVAAMRDAQDAVFTCNPYSEAVQAMIAVDTDEQHNAKMAELIKREKAVNELEAKLFGRRDDAEA